jgi:protein SCO1/2
VCSSDLSLLFFGYTFCPDICPTTLTNIMRWKQALGADGDKMRVVFVSVDPDRDTPVTLAEYLSSFGPGFMGVSLSKDSLSLFSKYYGAYYERKPLSKDDYTMDHTALIFMVDAAGHYVSSLSSESPDQENVAMLRRFLTASQDAGE